MNYLLDAILAWKTANKLRSDSSLNALNDEQMAESIGLMLGGMSYEKESKRLLLEYGANISRTTVFDFYHAVTPYVYAARRREAAAVADVIGKEMESSPINFESKNIELIQQTAFEVLSNPVAAQNSDSLKTLVSAVLKVRDQNAAEKSEQVNRELKEKALAQKDAEIKLATERLKLLQDNAAQAREKLSTVVNKGGITPETLATIEETLKLL